MISGIVGILSFDSVLSLLLLLCMHVFCRRNYIYPRMMVKGIPFYSIHFQSVLLLHFILYGIVDFHLLRLFGSIFILFCLMGYVYA